MTSRDTRVAGHERCGKEGGEEGGEDESRVISAAYPTVRVHCV